MMRLFREEFGQALEHALRDTAYPEKKCTLRRRLTIATGKLAFSTIQEAAEKMMQAYPGLAIHVQAIRNDFFGETITVAGLVTGQDLIAQLKETQAQGVDLGETLLIPGNMLRSGEQVFLDDVTVSQVEQALGLSVTAVEAEGQDFVDALLDPAYRMDRENEGFVYVRGYDR